MLRPQVVAAKLRHPAAGAAGLYLVLASVWIFASDRLLLLFVSDPAVVASFSTAKGMAYVAVTTALLYFLLKTWNPSVRPEIASEGPPFLSGQRGLVGAFLGLSLLVPLVGYGVVKLQEPHVTQKALDELQAIGELKAVQIKSWLDEWSAHARGLMASAGFVESVELWQRTGDASARNQVLATLRTLESEHGYEVVLFDAAGRRLRDEDGPSVALGPSSRALAMAALREGRMRSSDLYRDDAGRIRLDAAVPLLVQDPSGPRVVGAVLMRPPAASLLQPLIDLWPTLKPSGETTLIRREGDEVVFLNTLRHQREGEASLRLPVAAHPRLPAAVGVLSGSTVLGDAVDYRGRPVIAATRPIEGSSWMLVTKLDRDEVLAPLEQLTRWVSLLALVAVATVAVVVAMLWRQQQRANRLEMLARTAEKDKLLKLFYDLPFMGMAMISAASGRFVHANDHLCDTLACTRSELLALGWADFVHPDDLARVTARTSRLLAGRIDGVRLEARFLRRDGRGGIATIDMRAARSSDGRTSLVLAVIQDISERKQNEERTRQAATVFENTRDGVLIADLDARILAVNRAFSAITGYAETDVVGLNPRLLQSGRHGPEFYRALWTNVLTTGQWQGEVWNRRKNGEIFPAWTTITAVRDDKGLPTHYVGVFTDIGQVKSSEERLAHLAHYDPLTDLPNRLLLQSRIDHALERAQRHGERAALLFIDLDHFKTVNDSLGHMVGDQLLVDVARRLGERVREEDTLGRFGGDEFVLVLHSINEPEQAAVAARDLLACLAEPFRLANGNEVFVGGSIGISVYPEDGQGAADLLRDADAAMYQAKERGRNRYCFYTADMSANAASRLELEVALRRALERDEFVLHYQPKVDLRSGRVCGAEALIRWQPEGEGLQMPGRFIPLAERTGLIVPMGNWVLEAACRQLRSWHEAGFDALRVSVNVSARQFHSGELVTVVSEALARHGVAPERLELELTETMLMEDPEQTIAVLGALKRIGVTLSLDDFGTGYSSFAYLSRFPIDVLKIDQSFVRGIATEPQAAAIAVSIIDLAHRLNLMVVAEGVETDVQLGYLRGRECDEMQGYYFARPMPPELFEDLLREGRSLPAPHAPDLAPQRSLLLVADDPEALAAAPESLRQEGWRVLVAAGPGQALELLATESVQVLVCGQRLAQTSTVEFLRRVRELHPDTVRLALGTEEDLQAVAPAVNEGVVYRFLTMPWSDGRVRGHVREAFLYHEATIGLRAARHRAELPLAGRG